MPELSRRQLLRYGAFAAAALGSAAALSALIPLFKPKQVAFHAATFGADPTGTQDSGIAINNALSAASGHGPVFIPAGTYLLNTHVRVPSNTTLIMDRRAHLLRNHINATILNSAFARSSYRALGGPQDVNITIIGGILGLSPTRPVGQHVLMGQVSNLRILGLSIEDTAPGAYMIWLINVYQAMIANCTLDNPDVAHGLNDGIHIDSGKDITVHDSYVKTGDDAIALGNLVGTDALEDVTVSNCTLHSGLSRALAIYTQNQHEVRAVHIKNVTGSAPGTGPGVAIADYFNDNRYEHTVLADAPLAYYRMKEASGLTIRDSSPADLNGSLSSSGVMYAQRGGLRSDTSPDSSQFDPWHNYDNCLGFDGVNGEAIVPDFPGLDSSRSLECLVKTTTTSVATLLHMTNMGLYIDGDTHGGVTFSDNNGHVVSTRHPVNDGMWHHVAATYDSTLRVAQVYIDGAPGATTRNTFSSTPKSRLHIANDDTGNRLSGLLDEVVIYDSALSPARIAVHYHVAARRRLVHDIDLADTHIRSAVGAGAVLTRCSEIWLHRVNLGGSSFALIDAENVSLEQCECHVGPWSTLVLLDTVAGVRIVGGTYMGASRTPVGIMGQYVAGGVWEGTLLRGCTDVGASLRNCTNVRISNCSIVSNGLYGVVEVDASHDNAVVANDLRGSRAPSGLPGVRSHYSGNIT